MKLYVPTAITALAVTAGAQDTWDGICAGLSGWNCWDHRECWFNRRTENCCDTGAEKCPEYPADVDCVTLDENNCRVAMNRDSLCTWDNASNMCGEFYDRAGDCDLLEDDHCQFQMIKFKSRLAAGKSQCIYMESEGAINSRCRDFVETDDCPNITDQRQCGWMYGDTGCAWNGVSCIYSPKYETPTTCVGMKSSDCNAHNAHCYLDKSGEDPTCYYLESCEQITSQHICGTYASSHACVWDKDTSSCNRTTCTDGFAGEFCENFVQSQCPYITFDNTDSPYDFDVDAARSELNFRDIDYTRFRSVPLTTVSIMTVDDNHSMKLDNRDSIVYIRFGSGISVSCYTDAGSVEAVSDSTGVTINRRNSAGDVQLYSELTCDQVGSGTIQVETMFRGCEDNPCDNLGDCVQELGCGLFYCDCSGATGWGDYCEKPF